MTDEAMKELLLTMFRGWILKENSWNGEEYTRDKSECMIEACGGNVIQGELVHLFSHWSNDILSVAAHYGLALVRDESGKLSIREDVPPAPSLEHWWRKGEWRAPKQDPTGEA